MSNNIELFQLAYAYYNDNEYTKAIEEATKAINLDPSAPSNVLAPMYGIRGLSYKDRGNKNKDKNDYELAIKDFTKMLKLFPNAIGYRNRGILYGWIGQGELSIPDFNNAISLDQNDVEAYIHRGIRYGANGNINQAISDWESALRIEPDNPTAKGLLDQVRKVL